MSKARRNLDTFFGALDLINLKFSVFIHFSRS
jgi:hypothetical protein